MVKSKKRFLGSLSIVLLAVVSFSINVNAGSDTTQPTYSGGSVPIGNGHGYPYPYPAPTAYPTAGYPAPPSWPIQNTEASNNVKNLDKNFSADKEKPLQKDGWSGGADLVPAKAKTGEDVYNASDYQNSFMPLGTNKLEADDGSQTLSISIPPGIGLSANRLTKRDITDVKPDAESEKTLDSEVVRDWVAKEGFTLREIMEEWANEEGWEVIWNTHREYPLKASAIFRGRFKDVASAIVRGFSKAVPPPYAKFYLGNRVIVVRTMEDDNGN